MRQITIRRFSSKVRGVRRRLRSVQKWAVSFRRWFPPEAYRSQKYLQWKLPVLDRLVDPPTAKKKVQRECMRQLVNVCQHLIDAKPSNIGWCKVAALISTPGMFMSGVTVFFDEKYFQTYFDPVKAWASVDASSRFEREWGITIPENMTIKVKEVTDRDVDDIDRGQVWAIGEV